MAAVPQDPRLVLCAVMVLSACGGSVQSLEPAGRALEVKLPTGVAVHIRYESSEAVVADVIRQHLPAVLEQVSVWGPLQRDLWIRIHRDRASFRRSVRTAEHDHVNAWATDQSIDIQSTRANHTDHWWDQMRATLVHELTHVVFFQAARISGDWRARKLPFWFVEGMAVHTAQERTLSRIPVGTALAGDGSLGSLLRPSAKQLAESPQRAYALAGGIFAKLVTMGGEKGVQRIVRGLANGEGFAQVFRTVYDRSLREFERSWWNQLGQEF